MCGRATGVRRALAFCSERGNVWRARDSAGTPAPGATRVRVPAPNPLAGPTVPAAPRFGLPLQPARFLEAWLDAADRQGLAEDGWEVFTCVEDSVVLRLPAGFNADGEPLTRATLQLTRLSPVGSLERFEAHLVAARLNERRSCTGPELAGCMTQLIEAHLPARA